MKKRKFSFTAIEMILVCAIGALLLAVSLPALVNMAAGKQVTRAVTQISAKLSLARATAVSGRTHVAMVFPQITELKDKTATPEDETGPQALYNCSYRLAVVRKDGSVYKFVKWVPGEDWEIFAEGAAILADDDDFVNETEVADVDLDSLKADAVSNIARAIIFSPTGKIVMPSGANATDKIQLRVAEAVLMPPDFDSFQPKKDSSGQVNYAVLTINPLSARSEISYVNE